MTEEVIQASKVASDPALRFYALTAREMIGYEPPALMMGNNPSEPE